MKCVLVTLNEMWWDKVEAFIRNNPDAITILGCSTSADDNKEDFINSPENAKVKELCKLCNYRIYFFFFIFGFIFFFYYLIFIFFLF